MPNPDPRTLWQLTEAAGPLDQRFFLDDTTRLPFDAIACGVASEPFLAAVRDAHVMIRTTNQLGAALALLALDGIARRIVLCTPDLSPEHMRFAIDTAEVGVVASDRPLPELADLGVKVIIMDGPAVTPTGFGRDGRVETEWALFTSGTTGPPKMAIHSLAALTGVIARDAAPATGSVWCTFYDIRRYGGLQILLRALIGGGSMVLSSEHEAPVDFLARAGGAGVTFISGTPTHWRRAMLSPAAALIAPRDVRMSGEVADQAIIEKLRATYPNARVCHAFASTEGGVAFEVADGLAGFPAAWVGQPRGVVELGVVDGTLRIRSPRTATRYLGDKAPPLKEPDGFVDTKDMVELRGERYHFVGRRDGVINVGGLKVHPEEVEAVVNRHPFVEMSLVRSRRSPIIGAIVVADVVLSHTADDNARESDGAKQLEAEIIESCRQALAWFKVPASVRIVPSLNVNAAGKLVRKSA
ncbi:MAG TPA: fatty acid--CoA ligase family protein [Rhodopila sp.]|uniref:class I adenylate-forming enzyme family protein n=1 Tax=Rhodopila sp. TaxID=2480087 RepID=UPI002B9A4623|nr:fatty acid--CoA ligase family protein [Rhodopila sp.]HVY14534.1 fatty acid--CoA ligase family protein [Rhodopila sp.]